MPSSGYDRDCRVRFGIVSNETFATAEFMVDYGHADGEFVGLGKDVECTRIDESIAAWATNWNCSPQDGCYGGNRRALYVNMFAGRDVAAPFDLLECRFASNGVPEPSDFRFEDVLATTRAYDPIDPPPTPAVTGIDCDTPSPTTTSTTLPDACAGVSCGESEACSDGICVPAVAYEVDISLASEVRLGALQTDTAYDCTEGTFDGERIDVSCTRNPAVNALVSLVDLPCDQSRTGHLRLSFVSLVGFEGPIRLATCRYTSATHEAPTPERFDIVVEDASTPELSPVTDVDVVVSGIRPLAE